MVNGLPLSPSLNTRPVMADAQYALATLGHLTVHSRFQSHTCSVLYPARHLGIHTACCTEAEEVVFADTKSANGRKGYKRHHVSREVFVVREAEKSSYPLPVLCLWYDSLCRFIHIC